MIYLRSFNFVNEHVDYKYIVDIKRTCYNSYYPFDILSKHRFETIDFEPITILYGGNGSGKTTALNIIAEKTKVKRQSIFNSSNFFPDYVNMCDMELEEELPENSQIITSDDVFDFMLNIRNINKGIHEKREELFEEYVKTKFTRFQMKSLDDYEELKKVNHARSITQSKYIKENLTENIRGYSNGESAYRYFLEQVSEEGLYILDEPENSLSPKLQIELVKFIEDSARFLGCQFIISTHSPFILAIKGAKIYDLDEDPVYVKRWTDLENVRTYYNFFKEREEEF